MLKPKYESYPSLADATSQWPLNRFTRGIQILWNYLCRMCNLRTSEHISRLECIICSNFLYIFSVIFNVECLCSTVFVYNVNDRNVTLERLCIIRWKQSVDQILTKYQTIQGIHLSLFFWRSGQIFRKYDNFKIWPWHFMAKVREKVNGQCHIWNKSTNIFTSLLFRANRVLHS